MRWVWKHAEHETKWSARSAALAGTTCSVRCGPSLGIQNIILYQSSMSDFPDHPEDISKQLTKVSLYIVRMSNRTKPLSRSTFRTGQGEALSARSSVVRASPLKTGYKATTLVSQSGHRSKALDDVPLKHDPPTESCLVRRSLALIGQRGS